MNNPGVDIVVPIYNARADVTRCVESVLRHAAGDWRLLLVDDASTDQELVAFLQKTAADHGQVVYLKNKVNGGFVVTANHGMSKTEGRDVLLLNSDTVVTAGFIEKHIKCVYADPKTGIASPFTNNGTICSIPNFCHDNELPEDLSIDEYAAMIERISYCEYPELVTAVGFCMYIRAELIEKLGLFDEEAFGRGFGEENDYCERAKKKGWKIRLVDDCFVAHMGKASFGAEGKALEHSNSKILARMHPTYFADVHRYIHDNPLRKLQDNVRFHMRREAAHQNKAAMFVLHASPVVAHAGGTEFFVRRLVEGLALPRAVVVWPEWNSIDVLEVINGRVDEALKYSFELPSGPTLLQVNDDEIANRFAAILDAFDVGFAHIHHLLRWPFDLWRHFESRGIPFAFTAHDFLSVCPSFNLMDRKTHEACPCDNSPAAEACVRNQYQDMNLKAPADPMAVRGEIRSCFGDMLNAAVAVFTPSKFAADRLTSFHPQAAKKVHAIAHGYDRPEIVKNEVPDDQSTNLRVAIFGRFADPAKGTESYLRLIEKCKIMPIEWHFYGNLDANNFRRRLDRLGMGEKIVEHGNYVQAEICQKLTDDRIDLSLILPQCDETFCFTLSEAWLAGVPVIATRRGALIERCERTGAGILVDHSDEAFEHLQTFANDRKKLTPIREAAQRFEHPAWRENFRAHRDALATWIDELEKKSPSKATEARKEFLVEAYMRGSSRVSDHLSIPAYHAAWWFQQYLRIKPLIPTGMRQMLKKAYLHLRRDKAAEFYGVR